MRDKRKKQKLAKQRTRWATQQGFPVSQCGNSCRRCNGPNCPFYIATPGHR